MVISKMSDGEYILPRVNLSQNSNGTKHLSVIDIEGAHIPEKQTASEVVSGLRNAFRTGKTKPYEYRVQQLKNIKKFLKQNGKGLCEALYSDLRKPEHESYTFEIDLLYVEIDHILRHLKGWMKPEKPEKLLINFFDQLRIYSDPLGVVLVMGAWNYPLLLTLSPVLGAIAAGNCCVIKPSDLAPNTAQFLYNTLLNYVDKECYYVYLGGIPETTDLLKERFDYIFFTGSPQVGKIIHQAAAKYLTPCTLELGGKSPTYIDSTADIQMATKRILWGKFANCGQTCVAPDYILCSKEIQEKFVHQAEKYMKEFFGENMKQSKDFARMVNERHFIRVVNLLKNQRIALGGDVDAQDLYISPTILVDVKPEDDIMNEEIFGPVLPIINIRDANEAVRFINEREKPLALYVFTKDQRTKDLFLNNTTSGSVCINDTVMQVSVATLPFGGVGNSGMGNYHGKKTFDTFVHKKSVLLKTFSFIAEKVQGMRYPPYTAKKTRLARLALKSLNRSIDFGTYLKYACVFGLGVAVTIGGFYIKKSYDEK